MKRQIGSVSWKRFFRQGAVVICAAGLLVWLSWLLTQRRGPMNPPGGLLADVALQTSDGHAASLKGCRAILVVSAGCPSCLVAMRLLDRASGEAGRLSPLVCVSLSPREETRRMLEETGARYPVVFASGAEIRAKWNISLVPSLIMRDGSGMVLDVLSGSRCIERGPAALVALVRGRMLP